MTKPSFSARPDSLDWFVSPVSPVSPISPVSPDAPASPVQPLRRRGVLQAAALLAGAACEPAFAVASAGPARTVDADVILLCAGLAGLHAARQLEAGGLSVRVLEGSARIGGRAHTLDNLPGHPETGGNQIGAAYTRVLASASQLGLVLQPTPASPLLRDDGLVGASPLASITVWREPAHAGLDLPVLGELRAQGLGDAALRLLAVNNSYGDTLADTSLLNLYGVQRNGVELMKTPGPVFNVAGGNQRLPEAMARALRGEVLLNRRAVALDSHAAGVSVNSHDGHDGSRYRARWAVCALPLPAMRPAAHLCARPAGQRPRPDADGSAQRPRHHKLGRTGRWRGRPPCGRPTGTYLPVVAWRRAACILRANTPAWRCVAWRRPWNRANAPPPRSAPFDRPSSIVHRLDPIVHRLTPTGVPTP